MRLQRAGCGRIFLLGFFLVIAIGSAQADLLAPADLLRSEDPVVIKGEKFPALLGSELAHLGLFAFKNSGLAPIPFQIDEKTPSGEYVFTEGEKKNSDPQPDFDANDELVFMAKDAGDRTDSFNLPGLVKAYEIEISDPRGRGRAWAYLGLFTSPPARSPVDYVQQKYLPETDSYLIEASNYAYSSPARAVYYDYLALRQPDGSLGPDLVDQLKIRGKVFIFFGRVKIPFNFDQLVHSRITAWKDGAVRVIKRGEGYLKVAVVKIEGSGYSVLYFYPNFFIYPMTLELPMDLRKMVSDIELYGATDFTKSAYGWHYYDAKNPFNPEVVLDGKMSPAEENLKRDFDHDWHCNIGAVGNFCHRIIFPPEWKEIKREVFYLDDAGFNDPPEFEPGFSGNGYLFRNFIRLKKGAQTYWMHYYFPKDFQPGEEWKFLDILDHPLKIKVQQIK